MKLGRLNHIGVATPSIAESVSYYRDTMGASKIGTPFDLARAGGARVLRRYARQRR